jgi:hypothetical protein
MVILYSHLSRASGLALSHQHRVYICTRHTSLTSSKVISWCEHFRSPARHTTLKMAKQLIANHRLAFPSFLFTWLVAPRRSIKPILHDGAGGVFLQKSLLHNTKYQYRTNFTQNCSSDLMLVFAPLSWHVLCWSSSIHETVLSSLAQIRTPSFAPLDCGPGNSW